MTDSPILPNPLLSKVRAAILDAGGWLAFDAYMALALYAPGLGYYANHSAKFGLWPGRQSDSGSGSGGGGGGGSDFVTAPELTPLFGQTVAKQIAQAMASTETGEIWEFGAGSGALARDILQALDDHACPWARYTIVELSAVLRQRQQETLAAYGDRIRWVDALPDRLEGVVVGNEVLDAMPVKLLARQGGQWFERGVTWLDKEGRLAWQDQLTSLRPPCDIAGDHDYLTEIHPQATAFVATLAQRIESGAIFLIDYGFPEHEYYLAQRHMGTLMCHQAHRADTDPLSNVGLKDITAHVNFTQMALAAQEVGLELLGYTSQARFLMNCGLLDALAQASFADKAMAQKLLMEHEMGELFKVIGWHKPRPGADPADWLAIGFAQGDRSHRL